MYYYYFNIRDFNNDTRHLTRLERSIYRDMIDYYYTTEKPLVPANGLARLLLANTPEEIAAIETCLHDFFTHEEDGYHQGRCDREIEVYQQKLATASKAGKASAKARRLLKQMNNSTPVQRPLNDRTTGEHDPCNQPRTKNQEPRTKKQVRRYFVPPSVDEAKIYCAERNNNINSESFIDYYQARGWQLKSGQKMKDWKAAIRQWERNNIDKPSEDMLTKITNRDWATT